MISSAKLIDSGNRRKLTGDSGLDLNASNGEITILNFFMQQQFKERGGITFRG